MTNVATTTTSIAPAANSAAASNAPAEGSQDFLAMLGQFLGAAAPTPAVAAHMGHAALADADSDAGELLDSAALEAMLPFVVATPQNTPPVPAATAPASLNASALVAGSIAGANRSVLLEALTAGLAENADGSDAAMLASLSATASPLSDALNARGDAATRALHTPVGSSAWADELGTRLTLLTEKGQHSASLRLSPEHLGPLEVRISIRDDQASVWFGAAHADTRAAIEQALPRLRELFLSQGLCLADAGVSQEAPRDQRQAPTATAMHDDAVAADATGSATVISHGSMRLVDAYA